MYGHVLGSWRAVGSQILHVAIVAACGLGAASGAGLAHEFWVAPTDYALDAPRHFTVTVGDGTRDGIGIDGGPG